MPPSLRQKQTHILLQTRISINSCCCTIPTNTSKATVSLRSETKHSLYGNSRRDGFLSAQHTRFPPPLCNILERVLQGLLTPADAVNLLVDRTSARELAKICVLEAWIILLLCYKAVWMSVARHLACQESLRALV